MNSALRDQIRSASAALVRRKKVTLPECGIEVQVRGLMSGEALRIAEAKRRLPTQIAIGTEDPATGAQMWNPNSKDDLDEIEGLHSADMAALVDEINQLSGLDKKMGKTDSPSQKNGSSPSPADSGEPSPK